MQLLLETRARRLGFPVSKADNDVLDGIRVTANLLKQRKIVICEDCGSCLEEIAGYCWEDGGTECSTMGASAAYDNADSYAYFARAAWLNQ